MKFRLILKTLVSSGLLLSCANTGAVDSESLPFESKPKSVNVSPGMIDEASGIAQSNTAGHNLWVEQDSGNPTEIYRLGADGVLIGKVTIKGVTNRDWEDIVLSKGPATGTDYIYLAETGDNFSKHDFYQIYRFPEPVPMQDTVESLDKISFRYEDGSHDAEAILVDHISKDIYIITKRDAKSLVFRLAYPQSLTEPNVARLVGELPFNGVVSASLALNSKEILIKTYTTIYYWKKEAGETIESTLRKTGQKLGYSLEPQGEAICFAFDSSGFYTLSEKPLTSSSVDLHFYKRK
jgi:hypothetical protein